MPRLPEVTRDALPEDLRADFDTVIAANGGGKLAGPNTALINSPTLTARRAAVSEYMRSGITLPARVIEVAILVTARCLDGAFVWSAHAGFARKAGVADTMIDAIRDGGAIPATPADEHAIAQFGLELMQGGHRVSQPTYEAALEQFGPRHLVELTSLMGHYAQNVFLVNAFEVNPPADSIELPMPTRGES